MKLLMKRTMATGALLLLQLTSGYCDTVSNFGPGGCISVFRSVTGTCVIMTDCQGKNIKDVEFAFTCEAPQNAKGEVQQDQLQKHSFGLGGFLSVEKYDT